MIGYICSHKNNGAYDLGFYFHLDYHRKGYVYESIATAMEYIAKERKTAIFTAGTALRNISVCVIFSKSSDLFMRNRNPLFS